MARNVTGERKRSGPGWLRVTIGLAFLAVAGFAFGMVSGVVWQDPGLAWAYFTGKTEDVAWTESAGSPVRDVAAAPAEPEPAADPQVRRERAAAAAAAPVPPAVPTTVAAAPPAGRFAVQVGAFATSRAAEDLAASLRSKGFDVSVSPGTQSGEARWRVRVGPLASRDAAEAAADRLKRVEKLPTWILSEDAD